jgi:hypothetical protein
MIMLMMPKITWEKPSMILKMGSLLPDMMQGKSEQDGKQQHLEYIAAGKGTDDAGRYHIQQEGNYPWDWA